MVSLAFYSVIYLLVLLPVLASSAPVSRTSIAKWTDGIIPYEFGAGFENPKDRQDIIGVFTMFSSETCVRFVERRQSDTNFVSFSRREEGCVGNIGMKQGGQLYELGNDCLDKATVAHQILHILGLRHENVNSAKLNNSAFN